MHLDDYQEIALISAVFPRENNYDIIYPALKLAGEAGEVAEKIGKCIRDGDANFEDLMFRASIARELGDVLWYIAALADSFDYTLSEIAEINLDKLSDRKARGTIFGSGDYR